MTFLDGCFYFGLCVLVTLACVLLFLRSCADHQFSKFNADEDAGR